MAYFSFYRIIKDLLQTILGKKFLRLFLIVVIVGAILLLLDRNFVSAVEINGTTYPDFDELVSQYSSSTGADNPFVTIIRDNTNTIKLIISQSKTGNNYPLFTGSTYIYFWRPVSYNRQNNQWVLFNNLGNQQTGSNFRIYDSSLDNIIYNNSDLYNENGTVAKSAMTLVPPINYPEILTSQNDIETLLFDVLRINAKDYSEDDLYLLCYDKNFTNTESLKNLYPVKEFLLNQNSKYYMPERTIDPTTDAIYWIDRVELGLNWAIGNTYGFRFALRVPVESEFSDWAYEYLTEEMDYTISSNVLQSKVDDLNAQTKEAEQTQREEETKQSIDNINNFLNDDKVDDNVVDLPSDTTTDITADGINNIFTFMYNAFCTGEPRDIVLPIPYTDKSIIISPYYLENIINQSEFSYIKSLIHLAYWYVISVWVVKDVMDKIQKIKEGDIENVETTNIKGEML